MSGSAGRPFYGDFNGGNDGEKEQKKGGFSSHQNGASKSKKSTPFPLRKLQRFFTRSSSPSSCSVSHKNSSLSSGKTRFSNRLCCCLCLSSPQMLVEIPNGGSTAPSVSSYGHLRSLIEANDFYSNGCNTHLPN